MTLYSGFSVVLVLCAVLPLARGYDCSAVELPGFPHWSTASTLNQTLCQLGRLGENSNLALKDAFYPHLQSENFTAMFSREKKNRKSDINGTEMPLIVRSDPGVQKCQDQSKNETYYAAMSVLLGSPSCDNTKDACENRCVVCFNAVGGNIDKIMPLETCDHLLVAQWPIPKWGTAVSWTFTSVGLASILLLIVLAVIDRSAYKRNKNGRLTGAGGPAGPGGRYNHDPEQPTSPIPAVHNLAFKQDAPPLGEIQLQPPHLSGAESLQNTPRYNV